MTPEEFLEVVYSQSDEDYGLCSPPIDAQQALNILKDHFLGEDWYVSMPQSPEQCNTDIVHSILFFNKHSMLKRFIDKLRGLYEKRKTKR